MERKQKTVTGHDGVRWLRTFGLPVLLLVAILFLGGCSKEPLEESGNGQDGVLTEITLSPESMGEVAMDTRAVSGVDENKVSDLWVIQLNGDGTAALAGPRYFSGSQLTNASGKYTVKMKIKAENSRLYFIANTHNSDLYNYATISALVEAKAQSVSNEASLAAGNTLPMAGYFSGTPTVADLKNISLKRAVAKLTFKLAASLPNGCSFSLTSVKVCNVPKVLHLYRDPSKLDPGTTDGNCYPATSAGVLGEFADLTPSDKTLSATAKDCGWCYLPENGRGTGTATKQEDKTAATALGGATGQGNYATYVVVRGNYTNANNDTFDVSYRIYLGSDAISNYDVKRNTHYIVTATVKGIHEFDARIEINGGTLALPYYDYTDNLTGRFVYAQTNASDGTTWQGALTECVKTSGWRLPSRKELELMFCMRDTWTEESNSFNGQIYWSETMGASDEAYDVDFSNGAAYTDATTGFYPVRCIRSL